MVTGRIRFTERVLAIAEANGVGDIRYGAIYEIGDIACLPEPSCQRWIRRGKAVRVSNADAEDLTDGVQAKTETEAEVSDAEPSTIGTESAADAAPESNAVDDPAPVERPNRRPYRRRTQPDPE